MKFESNYGSPSSAYLDRYFGTFREKLGESKLYTVRASSCVTTWCHFRCVVFRSPLSPPLSLSLSLPLSLSLSFSLFPLSLSLPSLLIFACCLRRTPTDCQGEWKSEADNAVDATVSAGGAKEANKEANKQWSAQSHLGLPADLGHFIYTAHWVRATPHHATTLHW
jgi:hypothetical protein